MVWLHHRASSFQIHNSVRLIIAGLSIEETEDTVTDVSDGGCIKICIDNVANNPSTPIPIGAPAATTLFTFSLVHTPLQAYMCMNDISII